MNEGLLIAVGTLAVVCIVFACFSYSVKNAKEMEETEVGMVEITPEVKRALNELKYKEDDIEFMTIAIDFDGTCVEHDYPNVGKTLPFCVETLKRWQEKYEVKYILSTMRSGKLLEDAVKWCNENGIELFGIQKHPTQEEWTDSPKCHARWCIDDRNVGQFLTLDSKGQPCVDWEKTAEMFEPTLKNTYLVAKEWTKQL